MNQNENAAIKAAKMICDTAIIDAVKTSPTAVATAAFMTAQEMVKDGNTEGALYILREFPDVTDLAMASLLFGGSAGD